MDRFQKIPTKVLLIIVFILLTGIVFLARIRQKPNPATAGWWDETWIYRNTISVTNNTTQESNVYTTLSIGTSSLIADSKLQADCGDLRFTNQSGNLLDYYIVSGCGTTATSVNVNHTTFPAGQQNIYYYYGNSSAPNGTVSSNFDTQATNYTVGSVSSEEVTPGPVAYWKFDEGVGSTAHDSVGNNHSTISNATWQTEDKCISNKCIYSDGGTVNVNNSPNFYFSDKMSLSFWWKPMIQHTAYAYKIISKSTSTDDSTLSFYYFGDYGGTYPANQGDLKMYANAGGTWKTVSPTYKVTDDDLGKWMKVDFVYDPSVGGLLYINGQSKGSAVGSGTLATNTAQLRIGNSNPKNFFDDVKIYPYARSASQIKADYAAGLAGMGGNSAVNIGGDSTGKSLSDGLVGYWTMDEGVGTTTLDKSGNNNTGTFGTGSSAPAWSSGKFGIGTSYDGRGDYIQSTDTNFPTGSNSRTVSVWIKPNSYDSDQPIFTYGTDNTSQRFELGTRNTGSGQLVFAVFGGACGTADIPPTTQWSNITLVFQGTDVCDGLIYINGVGNTLSLQAGSNVSVNTNSNGYSQIGTNITTSSFFNGLIDEVRIYNRALSASEVKTLYNWAPGPVLHLKMDERTGSVTYDSSGNNLNGILTNMETNEWITGKHGAALVFDDANDRVARSDTTNSLLDITDNITLEAWVYYTSTPSNQARIVNKNDQYALYIGSNNKVTCYNTDLSPASLSSTTTILTNQWTHIACTISSGNKKLYINGIRDTSTSTTGSIVTNNDELTIGNFVSASDSYRFRGKIDDVRIYNYARTQKQILEDMEGRSGASKSTLPIAHWSFDEGYGTTARDSVGSNNGTFGTGSSAPTWTSNGKSGKALSFDGNDYIDTIDFSPIELTDTTLSFWAKLDDTTQDHDFISKGAHAANQPLIIWFDDSVASADKGSSNTNALSVMTYDGSTQHWLATPTNTINDTNWHHYVIVISPDNNQIRIYIDGTLSDQNTKTWNGIQNTTTPLRFGGPYPMGTQGLEGQLDNLSIYNYALSDDEVKQDYNSGMTMIMGQSSSNTGSTAAAGSSSQEYCIPGSTDPCSPPVAEWNFNERVGTTAYDSSGNNNHGIFGTGSSAPSWTTGKIGAGLNFDGNNDYVNVGNINNNFETVSFWFYNNDSFDKDTTSQSPLNFGAYDANNYGFIRFGVSTSLLDNEIITVLDKHSNTQYRSGYTSTTENISIGWHHLTIVRSGDSSNYHIYLDGIRVDNAYSGANAPAKPADDILIGASKNGVSTQIYYFNGKIDQVRIYNYARTPAQIAWDYNRGQPIAHWKLDENQGTTINDSMGTGDTGTLVNMTSSNWVNGKHGSALDFNNTTEYVNLNSNAFDVGTGDFSISLWTKVTDSDTNDRLFSVGNSNHYEFWVISTGQAQAMGGNSSSSRVSATGNNSLEDNTWHHILAVYDRDYAIKLYIDGILQSDVETGFAAYSSTDYNLTNARIGQYAGGSYSPDADIDDVQIYNYALTGDQVKTLYNSGTVSFQ